MGEYHKLLDKLINVIYDINISIREYDEYEAKVLLLNDTNYRGFNINYDEFDTNDVSSPEFDLFILSLCSRIEHDAIRNLFDVGIEWEIELHRLISSVSKLSKAIGHHGLHLRSHLKYCESYTELHESYHISEISGLLCLISNAVINLYANLCHIKENVDRYSLKPITRSSFATTELEKIKFNGGPALFGFIMKLLMRHGYIDPPFVNGDSSFEKLATLCYESFEINGELSSLKKYMGDPKNKSLSEAKAAKFSIPDFKDVK